MNPYKTNMDKIKRNSQKLKEARKQAQLVRNRSEAKRRLDCARDCEQSLKNIIP